MHKVDMGVMERLVPFVRAENFPSSAGTLVSIFRKLGSFLSCTN